MSQQPQCYLDNNATTRVCAEVVEVMLPFLRDRWGNPSSGYRWGRELRIVIQEAREKVAALINADPGEVVFTSGGTESINSVVQSVRALNPERAHLVTTAVEHAAMMARAAAWEREGGEVTYLAVGRDGSLDMERFRSALRPETGLVSIMWANNETGLIFPVEEVGRLCRERGIPFHTDAVQAAGKVRVDVRAVPVDYLSLSAHKLYAPKGIGLLYVRRGASFQSYLAGGGQESGRRGGTENVPYMVGFGRAAELAREHMEEGVERVRRLRDRLELGVLEGMEGVSRNGAAGPRLPNTSNLAFRGVEAEAVLLALDQAGICVSSGSACAAGSAKPSHVLMAMGLGVERAKGSLRFSLGRDNTEADVDFLLGHLPGIVGRLRSLGLAGQGSSGWR